MNEITDEQLACLNSWPEGTVGHIQEQQLISVVHQLCKQHGYGRMAQLVQGIEEIWRNPEEGGKKWQAFHERMELLKGTVAYYAAKREGKSDDEAFKIAEKA